MRDLVEAALDVGVEHPHRARVGRHPDGLLRVVGRQPRAKPEARGQEVGFEDRLEHDPRRRHHHPVGHTSDAERPRLARPARLRDADSSQRPRTVVARSLATSSSRNSPTPDSSIASIVTPSTPGAPRFPRTSPQAVHALGAADGSSRLAGTRTSPRTDSHRLAALTLSLGYTMTTPSFMSRRPSRRAHTAAELGWDSNPRPSARQEPAMFAPARSLRFAQTPPLRELRGRKRTRAHPRGRPRRGGSASPSPRQSVAPTPGHSVGWGCPARRGRPSPFSGPAGAASRAPSKRSSCPLAPRPTSTLRHRESARLLAERLDRRGLTPCRWRVNGQVWEHLFLHDRPGQR